MAKIINCPKCGFEQPDHRYCASCGVDMHQFQPSQAPIIRRVLKHWVFQVSLVVIAIIGSFSYLQHKHEKRLTNRMAAIESAKGAKTIQKRLADDFNPQSTPDETESGADRTMTAQATALGEYPSSESADPQMETELAAEAGDMIAGDIPDENKNESSTSTEASKTGDSSIRVVFAEVQMAFLHEIQADARSPISFGPLRAGVVSEIGPKLTLGQQTSAIRFLEPPEKLPFKINQGTTLYKGARDETLDQNLTLETRITPVLISENSNSLVIAVVAPFSDQPFQEQFVVPKNGGVLISGLLPHRNTLNEDESRMYASHGGILNILVSPAFQANTSEFVIFIETVSAP